METKLQIFANAELDTHVRTVNIKGEKWLVGKDICDYLGYVNHRDALAKHVDEEDKTTSQIATPSRGKQTMTVINVSGFFSLVLRSDKPEAKAYKRWVTSEVLPIIHKTGRYSVSEIQKTGCISMLSKPYKPVHIIESVLEIAEKLETGFKISHAEALEAATTLKEEEHNVDLTILHKLIKH